MAASKTAVQIYPQRERKARTGFNMETWDREYNQTSAAPSYCRVPKGKEKTRVHPSNDSLPARRKLLGSMVSAAALLGLNATGAAASPTAGAIPAPPESEAAGLEDIVALARLRNYKPRRSSSW